MAREEDPIALDWVADRALRVTLGEGISEEVRARVAQAFARLRPGSIPGLIDATPAYATILLLFTLPGLDPVAAEDAVRSALRLPAPARAAAPRVHEIPVCYDLDLGPDLREVARLHGYLDPAQVVTLHASAEYVVHFLGFSPGFAYLGGLPETLATPRLERPRLRVPAGSVAIGGAQAGVYPRSTPGGWRILGRTPLSLFDPRREPPATLALGDRVRFVPVDRARFNALVVDGA